MPIPTLLIASGSSDCDPGGFRARGAQAYGIDGSLLTWSGEAWEFFTAAQAAAVTFAPITSAQVLTTSGAQIGESRQVSDGTNAGARLIWAIPSGASAPAWCWWNWPQSAYTA